jgi:hypothetical protein
VITRLEHIGDETINNLITKRVVYPNVIQNVSIARKHQNDQISTQGLPTFSGAEYIESSESFSANEDDVASFPNLKNMC